MCRPLPASPAVASNSSAWAAVEFQAGRNSFANFTVSTSANPYADPNAGDFPLEERGPGTPSIPQQIVCNKAAWSAWLCGVMQLQNKVLNVPSDMMPAGDTDHHYSYNDEFAGGEYDFWLAQPPGSSGAVLPLGGAGFCAWGADGTNCSGSTATNIASSLGAVDATLLQQAESSASGTLPFALSGTVLCADPSYVYPATASDGANTNSSSACAGALAQGARPPEGTRWYIDLSDAQINATNNAPFVKVILRTMDRQHYGGVITDTNWSGAPGLSIKHLRGNFTFAASEAGVPLATDMSIPITTNGINLESSVKFCSNGTC